MLCVGHGPLLLPGPHCSQASLLVLLHNTCQLCNMAALLGFLARLWDGGGRRCLWLQGACRDIKVSVGAGSNVGYSSAGHISETGARLFVCRVSANCLICCKLYPLRGYLAHSPVCERGLLHVFICLLAVAPPLVFKEGVAVAVTPSLNTTATAGLAGQPHSCLLARFCLQTGVRSASRLHHRLMYSVMPS